jgi:hypothetical protein
MISDGSGAPSHVSIFPAAGGEEMEEVRGYAKNQGIDGGNLHKTRQEIRKLVKGGAA